MTDVAAPAAPAAPAPVPAAAAPLSAAAALLGDAPAPPADPAAPAPAVPAPVEGKPWYGEITDPDLKAWVDNKEFKTPADALESQRNLEKLLGGDKLPLPKDEADKDGWERVYKALGRPDDAKGYKLPIPDGMDPKFAGEASTWFHGAGLSNSQAVKLTENWNTWAQAQMADAEKAFQVQSANDMADLHKEWGSQADANVELYRRGCKQFGVDQAMAAKLETAVGTKDFMKLMVGISKGLAEHAFELGDNPGLATTQAGAMAKIAALKGDTEWTKSYLAGDKTKLAEMERLQKLAFPVERAA